MNYLKRLPLAMTVLGALTLGTVGCSVAPPAQLYQLQQPVMEKVNLNSSATVLLGPLNIADYLQRESLLQRNTDGSLIISTEARWAGNLEDEIGHFLLRQISAELGTSRISLYPDRIGMKAQAQVVLSISRLDSGVEQPAVLEAQWRVLDGEGVLRKSQLTSLEQSHNGSVGDQVRAQSELLAQLSKQLGQALQETVPNQPSKRQARNKVSTISENEAQVQPEQESIKMPKVELEFEREPEVYRF